MTEEYIGLGLIVAATVAWTWTPSEATKLRRRDKAFRRGFDYCAGELLRGRSIQELEDELDFVSPGYAFDQGMADALRKWKRL